MVNTKKSARRSLRFNSLKELSAELDRIEAAENAGTLRVTGNWTAGQILTHVAAWMDYAYDGYPLKPPPFFIRWILRWMLKSALRDGLKPGVKIPGVKGGTTGAEDVDTRTAIARLRQSIARLSSNAPIKFASPAFGEMTDDQRVTLNLRHAELHLGFLAFD
jgi:hypothetical protein